MDWAHHTVWYNGTLFVPEEIRSEHLALPQMAIYS